MRAGASRWGILLLALVGGAASFACGSPRLDLTPDPGPYDRITPGERENLWGVRAAIEIGDHELAAARLAPILARNPDQIALRCLRQDVELMTLAAGATLGDLGPLEATTDPGPLLFARYFAVAEADPTPVHLVLAGRLADDVEESLALLARAAELDPACIWAHYGTAFRCFLLRRFPEAREAAMRARELDPGHLPTMRLTASMFAGAGDTALATRAMTTWLERTREDPLVPRADRAEARLDLAALLILEGAAEDALELLDEIDVDLLSDRARYELARAAAHEANGENDLALAAARRAGVFDSGNLLALVQEAMLLERTGGAGEERAVWERLLEAAAAEREDPSAPPPGADETTVDFQSLLIQLMAHTRLERLRGEEPGLGAPEPGGEEDR